MRVGVATNGATTDFSRSHSINSRIDFADVEKMGLIFSEAAVLWAC